MTHDELLTAIREAADEWRRTAGELAVAHAEAIIAASEADR